MLVLSRTPGERIIISTADGDIIVTLKGVRGPRAQIGIEAPRMMRILRHDSIRNELPSGKNPTGSSIDTNGVS